MPDSINNSSSITYDDAAGTSQKGITSDKRRLSCRGVPSRLFLRHDLFTARTIESVSGFINGRGALKNRTRHLLNLIGALDSAFFPLIAT